MAECFPELSASDLNNSENKLGSKMIKKLLNLVDYKISWFVSLPDYLFASVFSFGKYLICWTLTNDMLLNFCSIIVNCCTIINY